MIYYSDLDGDQVNEEINVDHNPDFLKIMIMQGKGVVEQYNLSSKAAGSEYLYVEDYNLDGYKEIFILSIRNNSLLLSIIDPLKKQGFILKERLIYSNDSLTYVEGSPSCFFLGTLNAEKENTIVFATSAGFNKQPRSIFKYNIEKDELESSPLMGASLYKPVFEDLDGDSIPEILLSTRAVGNYSSFIPYTDQSTWLMALNKDLQFHFEPKEIPKYPSNLYVSSYGKNDSVYLVALHEYLGSDTIQSGLYLFNSGGKQLKFCPVEFDICKSSARQ